MKNTVYTIDELKGIVNPIAKKYQLNRVTLFGSYAKGTANSNSDIDIYVEYAPKDNRPLFWPGGLYNDIQSATDKEVDLLFQGFNRDSLADGVYREILNTGVTLYGI